MFGIEEELGAAAVLVAGLAVAGVEDDGRHIVAHEVVDVADEAVVVREADAGGQKALRDAEGVVGLRGVAPFGDDVSLVDDQPGLRGAGGEGTHGVAERFTPEGPEVAEGEVAGGLGLARDRDLDGALDGGRVEAELGRGAAFPVRVTAGEVRLGGEEVGGGGEEGRGA